MRRAIYRFTFERQVPMCDVEATLHLAIIGAEGLHGESSVRLDAAYTIDEQRRLCVVDARDKIGRYIRRLFARYLTREFGENMFCVRRKPVSTGAHGPSRESARPTPGFGRKVVV